MILPLKSIKHVRVQVFQEHNSVNIKWRYQCPFYDRKENIEVTRPQIVQLRLYYDGRIVFSYSAQPSLGAASPQLDSVQVGLSLNNLDQLHLTDSLELLDRESGVMMIPRAQFYQVEWSTLIGLDPSRSCAPIGGTLLCWRQGLHMICHNNTTQGK